MWVLVACRIGFPQWNDFKLISNYNPEYRVGKSNKEKIIGKSEKESSWKLWSQIVSKLVNIKTLPITLGNRSFEWKNAANCEIF